MSTPLERSREILEASLDRPSVARVYDYLLGGTHNYAIDREFAERQDAITPRVREFAHANRAFLRRAVTVAVEHGIRQFIDIGSGLPTQGNVHEIADARSDRRSRVVYIDNDPIAEAHSHILLADSADTNRHAAVHGDFIEPDELWQQILDTGLIDPHEPACLLTVALLHFFGDADDPHGLLARYRARLASGSVLVANHGAIDPDDAQLRKVAERSAKLYADQATQSTRVRDPDEIAAFFGDWELLEPGLVWINQWRPDPDDDTSDPVRSGAYGGMARKP